MNRHRLHLQTEVDASFLYRTLGEHADDPALAEIYFGMANIEDSHARKMLEKYLSQGITATLPQPSVRARIQVKLARLFGWNVVLSSLMATEKNLARQAMAGKSSDTLTGGEANHVQILHNLTSSSEGMKGGMLARLENRHRSMGGNALRAAVLGANDGLVTNLSLIMGVAGAAGGHDAIVVAGVAGLLAGAISMALGEWLSVQSSRELNQRQIEIETMELENSPEEELLELTLIYQSKGVPKEQAEEMASTVLQNKDTAVDTLVREELGLDSEELGGSAWEAAVTSFVLFAIGAILPLIPFLVLRNYHPVWISLGFSVAGLFILGAAITFYTGKSVWYSGFRQILFGLVAAGITYGIGKLIGITLL